MEDKVLPIEQRFQNIEKKVFKTKEGKLPNKAKVGSSKAKKGYIGILYVNENRIVSFEKQQVEDSTYRTKDGLIHSLDGRELLFWKRYPFVIQPAIKINPIDLVTGKNETRGQKLIQAKLLKDVIKVKKAAGNILIFVVIGIVLFVIGKFVLKLF